MWFDEISIDAFGKLRNVVVRLRRGLNVVLGPNESGKSTLQDFLWAALYVEISPPSGAFKSDFLPE